ncbi:MAG TPA: hypothetical protein VFZ25_03165 [Chloroflexota bacterium]|nr:hypothetical protein [Chloroflexota bacterium]
MGLAARFFDALHRFLLPVIGKSPTGHHGDRSLLFEDGSAERKKKIEEISDRIERLGYHVYLKARYGQVDVARNAIKGIISQFKLAAGDPALIRNPAWKTQMATYLALVMLAGEELETSPFVPNDMNIVDSLMAASGRELIALSTD